MVPHYPWQIRSRYASLYVLLCTWVCRSYSPMCLSSQRRETRPSIHPPKHNRTHSPRLLDGSDPRHGPFQEGRGRPITAKSLERNQCSSAERQQRIARLRGSVEFGSTLCRRTRFGDDIRVDVVVFSRNLLVLGQQMPKLVLALSLLRCQALELVALRRGAGCRDLLPDSVQGP